MLNERLAALNRFISQSTDKCKPFFQALKKNKVNLCWNEEREVAFQRLKRYLVSPLLSKPYSRETLYLYLTVSDLFLKNGLIGRE